MLQVALATSVSELRSTVRLRMTPKSHFPILVVLSDRAAKPMTLRACEMCLAVVNVTSTLVGARLCREGWILDGRHYEDHGANAFVNATTYNVNNCGLYT